MMTLCKAGMAFLIAAILVAPPSFHPWNARWQGVAEELSAAHPQARLTAQFRPLARN